MKKKLALIGGAVSLAGLITGTAMAATTYSISKSKVNLLSKAKRL